MNVRGLGSSWKQTCFLNDLSSFYLDVCIVITDVKLTDSSAFSPLQEGYKKFISPGRQGRGVVVLLKKDSSLKVCTIFLDQEGKVRI